MVRKLSNIVLLNDVADIDYEKELSNTIYTLREQNI